MAFQCLRFPNQFQLFVRHILHSNENACETLHLIYSLNDDTNFRTGANGAWSTLRRHTSIGVFMNWRNFSYPVVQKAEVISGHGSISKLFHAPETLRY